MEKSEFVLRAVHLSRNGSDMKDLLTEFFEGKPTDEQIEADIARCQAEERRHWLYTYAGQIMAGIASREDFRCSEDEIRGVVNIAQALLSALERRQKALDNQPAQEGKEG
jgi:hypothetical protein